MCSAGIELHVHITYCVNVAKIMRYLLDRAGGISWKHAVYVCLSVCMFLSVWIRHTDQCLFVSFMYWSDVVVCHLMLYLVLARCTVRMDKFSSIL